MQDPNAGVADQYVNAAPGHTTSATAALTCSLIRTFITIFITIAVPPVFASLYLPPFMPQTAPITVRNFVLKLHDMFTVEVKNIAARHVDSVANYYLLSLLCDPIFRMKHSKDV